METERAYVLNDPEPPAEGVVVGHVYRPDGDSRRHTDHYICGSMEAAQRLVQILVKR